MPSKYGLELVALKGGKIMATRKLEEYKWTKDGRKWVFYTYTPNLNGKRKKYTSPAYFTKKEALEAEAEYALRYSGKPLDSNITFKHVKGHQNKNFSEDSKWNNYVDNLAVSATKLI